MATSSYKEFQLIRIPIVKTSTNCLNYNLTPIKLASKKPIDHYRENTIRTKIKVIKTQHSILPKSVELMKCYQMITRDKCLTNKVLMESRDMKGKYFIQFVNHVSS